MAYVSKYKTPGGTRRPAVGQTPRVPTFAQPTYTATGNTINSQKIGRIAMYALIVLVAGAALFFSSSENKNETFTYEREATDQKAPTPAAAFFNEQRTNELRGGNGISINYAVRFRGETVFQKEVKISKWNRFQQWLGSHPVRDQEVVALQEAFTETGAAWAGPPPITPVCDIAVDTSGGVDTGFQSLIMERINRVGCADMVNAGLGLELNGFRFGANDYIDVQSAIIAPGSRNLTGVTNAIVKVSAQEGTKGSTSLAAALFNILTRNQDKKFRTAAVFSDGIQFGKGADFYKNPPTDPSQYDKIFQTLEKEGGVKCPDLTGVWLYWYSPHDAKHASQIRGARDFWKDELGKKGATIKEMEY